MFIVIGILSILAGCYVFNQASYLIRLASIVQNVSSTGGMYAIVAICLILGGTFIVASKDGSKRAFIVRASWMFLISFIISVIHFSYGEFPIWTFISGAIFIFLSVWLFLNHTPRVKESPEYEEYIDPEKAKRNE